MVRQAHHRGEPLFQLVCCEGFWGINGHILSIGLSQAVKNFEEKKVEWKRRDNKEKGIIALNEVIPFVNLFIETEAGLLKNSIL